MLVQFTIDSDTLGVVSPIWINPMNVTDVTPSEFSEDTAIKTVSDSTIFVKENVELVVTRLNEALLILTGRR